MTIIRLNSLLTFLATVGITLNVEAVSLENKPPLIWPESRLSPIQLTSEDVISDGLEFTVMRFDNEAVPFFAASLQNWRKCSALSFRKASICFNHTKNQSIKVGVSIVRSQDWLIELNEESLTRYMSGVRTLNPKRFEWLNENLQFSPVANSSFLLGQPYKQVHYRVKPENPTQPVIEIRDLISEFGDWLIIFSIECPQDLADQFLNTSMMLMSGLAQIEDLE